MTAFDDLQNAWAQQSVHTTAPRPEYIIEKAKKSTRIIKIKHRWSIAILSVLVVFLVWFFGQSAGFRITAASAGFILMIVSILLRVVIEYISYRRFNKIAIDKSFTEYTAQITRFYLWRKNIHYFFTPLSLLTYSLGFVLLLPSFRQHLAAGFYMYIVFSGTVFLLGFAWFIMKQVKKEMKLLTFLRHI